MVKVKIFFKLKALMVLLNKKSYSMIKHAIYTECYVDEAKTEILLEAYACIQLGYKIQRLKINLLWGKKKN